ncbi:gamma-glutamyltranspeptidase / glutathione hydrolase [Poseidonocella pacifica]|uniref:Gamma-glutamyltranspeptidase / glutathione hydrolase n=1 Tax=Poseidonocella pacifica TaxID=871651 RepID=A0A1I0YDT3_9RHOB|nr:gamma-glutamyltransferase [Poseidonocella pacifica]SFB10947.1 gamma-glutamyltranspeptidase / glutathione hydrolase [Poseidonocella pacifica]
MDQIVTDRVKQTWTVSKKQLESPRGVVASQHFEAAEAGARVLEAGGNAMDAAIVAALVLSVVEPWLSGVGGGGLLLWAPGDGGAVDTLDFNVRASRNMDRSQYPLSGGHDGDWFDWPSVEEDRNLIGYPSICVPGAVAGFAAALEKHGTLSWPDALAPAIELAERGMRIDWFTSLALAVDAQGLSKFEHSAKLFLDNGRPRRVPNGKQVDYLPMPTKAATLRRLAQAGPRDFYEGEISRSLLADLQAGGSVIDAEDLASFRPHWSEAKVGQYRDSEVAVVPGLCAGPSLLKALSKIETELEPGASEAEAAAIYARAVRTTYEDRLKTMGHASAQGDCTSHLSVVDAQGNMVALTNTLLSRFGSKVTLPGTGVLMNNGMMWFDPRDGVPNSIGPGARPLANMSPAILRREGLPTLAIGAAGGRQIFPCIAQLISYVLDRGMTLEEAFHAPRIDGSGPTIVVDQAAAPDVAAAVSRDYPVVIRANALHPVLFAIPSAVGRAEGRNYGMAHPVNPWAACAAEGARDG